MNDRPEEGRLEQQLMALARATAYPPTPDLAAGFGAASKRNRTTGPGEPILPCDGGDGRASRRLRADHRRGNAGA